VKRASYREAIEYVALNDEPSEIDADAMIGFASVQLIAHVFRVDDERVARDVVRKRTA